MSKSLNITGITTDAGTQARVALDEPTVQDYYEAVVGRDVPTMPAVVVYQDGEQFYLADGFHRYEAHVRAGLDSIDADVYDGTLRDAILHAVGANARHGLRRSNADKRRAVQIMLDDKEWSGWSDNEIAKRCAVSRHLVLKMRPATASAGAPRKSGDGRTIATANIGEKPQVESTKKDTPAQPQPTEPGDQLKFPQPNLPRPECERCKELEATVAKLKKKLAETNYDGALPLLLDTPAFRAEWAAFIAHRKQAKAPMTDVAQGRMLKKLEKYSAGDAMRALSSSIEQGWKGVFPEKLDGAKQSRSTETYEPEFKPPSEDQLNSILNDGGR